MKLPSVYNEIRKIMTVCFFNEMMVIVDVGCFLLLLFNDLTWRYKILAIPY